MRISARLRRSASLWRVVDATGVGTPVVEMLRAARTGRELKPVIITGGAGERHGSETHYVAKTDLMAGLRVSFELQGIVIARRLQETPALVKELQVFLNSVDWRTMAGRDES